jgi:propionyl-CoA carboxylase alpha chain
MQRALDEMRIVGVLTTIPFAQFVMHNAQFQSGNLSTAFVEQEFTDDVRGALLAKYEARAASAFIAVASHAEQKRARELFVA